MNSSVTCISDVLNNALNIISPGFSPKYNFNAEMAAEYFQELVENSVGATPIFSGIIILEQSGDKYTVIDGLQRLTTINLLLCALCENYKNTSDKNEEARKKIFSRYLVNKDAPKLKLTGEDKDMYKKILFSEEISESEQSSNIYQTYHGFLQEIKNQNISGTELFRIISKIQFMVVMITELEVPVRELYQALNINKKGKSQINLITDFLTQKGVGDVWQQTLKLYADKQMSDMLESFLKDFLFLQSEGKYSSTNTLYNKFRSYFNKLSKYQEPSSIANTLNRYSQHYVKILTANFEDYTVKDEVIKLNNSDGTDAYPYLMEVVDDLENRHITIDVFINILNMINAFVKDRQLNPNTDVKINFAHLSKDLNKMLVRKNESENETESDKITINELNKMSTFGV